MTKQTKIITIVNQKGGVGKTTTVVNLAHGLTHLGKQVLLIDLDPQGNIASALNCASGEGTYYLLTMGRTNKMELQFVRTLVQATGRENLWYISGGIATVRAQNDVINRNPPASISHLRESLHVFLGGPDFVILDTSPSIGGLQERAGWAADFVMVPTNMDYLSNEGADNVAQDLTALLEIHNWQGKLLGVLPTFYETRTRTGQTSMEQLLAGFGDHVLPPIHRSTVFAAASSEGQTIFEYTAEHPHNKYAQRARTEYLQLAEIALKAR